MRIDIGLLHKVVATISLNSLSEDHGYHDDSMIVLTVVVASSSYSLNQYYGFREEKE